jgi:hypothetical protein
MATAGTMRPTEGVAFPPEVRSATEGGEQPPRAVPGPTPGADPHAGPLPAPGEKLTILLFLWFFSVLGFAVLCDLLVNLFR